MSVLATDKMSVAETGQMSSVETGPMSAVETGQMSAAETGQMSAVETRQMYSIERGLPPRPIWPATVGRDFAKRLQEPSSKRTPPCVLSGPGGSGFRHLGVSKIS